MYVLELETDELMELITALGKCSSLLYEEAAESDNFQELDDDGCQPGTRSHRIHIENISSYTRMTAKGFSLGVLPAWSPISRFFKGTMPASHRITTKRMVLINTGHSGLLASKSKASPSIPHPLNRRELGALKPLRWRAKSVP